MQISRLLLLFVLLVVVITEGYSQNEKITLEEIYLKPIYRQKGFSGFIKMNDGEYYAQIQQDNSINYYEFSSGDLKGTILNSEIFNANFGDEENISFASFNSDESMLLIAIKTKSIYRRSSESEYYIYDRNLQIFSPLDNNGKQMAAKFSPDGNKIAYVRDNNLYIHFLETGNNSQITTDGKNNEIINGMPDWVYEEEFAISSLFEWNNDGTKLAFIKFDETRVKEYTLTTYGNIYPELFKYKYPKPGENNSIVSVNIYDLNTKVTINADIGKEEEDIYIPRIKWMNTSDILTIIRLNRLQNKYEVIFSNSENGKSNVVLIEEDKCYINEQFDLKIISDDSFFRISSKSGYNHIYHYDKFGKLINQVTDGNWEVNDILGIDEINNKIYYSSNELSVIGKFVYSINFDGSNKKILTPEPGTNNAKFSSNLNYFVNVFSNANTPSVITVNDNEGNRIRLIDDNFKLKSLMNDKKFVKKEFFKFTTSDNVELNGWIMKPKILEEGKKYPVLMYVYAGPGSQSVIDSWGGNDFIWYQYLVQNDYIVACVDGRGTGGRGNEFEKIVYKNLGKYELNDQIEAVKYLGKLSYVDKNRIGIFGWSYGGYMVSLCMTLGAPYFKVGLAVAPVTDWRYYNDIYTERYMRTPKENPEGYYNYSPLNFADKLTGNLLIVHGSEDDNVHPQNTFDFIDRLVKANKQFEMMIYTNKNHSINGGSTRYHLFKKLTEFLFEKL